MKKLLTLLLLAVSCFAAAPIIESTIASSTQLTIAGQNFPTSPVVTLAGTTLTVVSHDTTQIVVTLPSNLAVGAYALVVNPGSAFFGAVISPNTTPAILNGFCLGKIPNNYAGQIGALLNLGAGFGYLSCLPTITSSTGPNTISGLPVTSAGVLKNLQISSYFNLPWGFPSNTNVELDFQVFVNNTSTLLGCSVIITGTTTTYTIGPILCADTSHSVNVNTGDLVSLMVSTPTAVIPRFNSGDSWIQPNINASLEKQ